MNPLIVFIVDFDCLREFINQHRIRMNLAVAGEELHIDLNQIYLCENICTYDAFLSGSCAEFFIDPPFSCIGDFDAMFPLHSAVAFFGDRPIDVDMLCTNEQHFYPETQIYRVRPVPHRPAFVTVDYVGDLKISRTDTRRYQFSFDQFSFEICQWGNILNYSKGWRTLAIRLLITKALLRQSRTTFFVDP